eukprot:TRINITY_DN27008_c0_g1_i1.p1 TRINITY_DN27008_c0_g1~~TRINITY_DN27008_c0_g1_i1.p1  ORF type:complete len:442 (+),score=98.00 TRINITY_DN27008_c0_g1_i1:44-1327(+)
MANAAKHSKSAQGSKASGSKKGAKATKHPAVKRAVRMKAVRSGKAVAGSKISGAAKPKTQAKAIKKAPVKKSVGLSMTAEAAKDMEALKENAKLLNKDTPADWPAGAIPNVRAFAPLPDGWHHAKKVTGQSGRGDGGKLRPCFVGPGGLVKWHKTDLEKHLGIKLEDTAADGPRPRCLKPLILKEFPADQVIRRTEKRDAVDYINKRCDRLSGMTVSDALLTFKYEKAGKQLNYMISDLRYDVKAGRLVLDNGTAPRPKKMEQLPKTGPVKREPSRCAPSKDSFVKVEPDGCKNLPQSRNSRRPSDDGIVKTKDSKRARTECAKKNLAPGGSKRASSATPSQQSSSSSNAGLLHIKENIFKPLMHRALSGEADQVNLYTLQGVGNQLNMEKLMLDILPDVLRTPPAERGALGQKVLKQFEAEMDKHL